MIKTILFDVDGTLIDSLATHLEFCSDLSKQYNLNITIPTKEQFKILVRNGIETSPIRHFFSAFKFPLEFLDIAEEEYEKKFSDNYIIKAFDGIEQVIDKLKSSYQLGIVTANIFSNICDPLGTNIKKFSTIVTKDNCFSKAHGIMLAMSDIQAFPSETVYIGDMPSDEKAAEKAGVSFIGATYGWGLEKRDCAWGIDSLSELPRTIESVNSYLRTEAL